MAVATEPSQVEQLAGRLFMEGVGGMHLLSVYLGVRLGLYATLTRDEPLDARQLAAATGLDTWYVREWLQAEMIAGTVTADGDDPWTARFTTAPGVREVLVEETNPSFLGGLPYASAAVGRVLPDLLEAFRTGAGVPYSAYGPEAVTALGALNRPAFVNALVTEWLPRIPDVHERLRDATRSARVADVGCGIGWASIELAKAFDHLRVDGYDSDESSIAAARRNAAEHGVSDRVRFEVLDATTGRYGAVPYEAVFFFECLHDIARPADALRAARAAVAEDGAVIVMDENVADTPAIGSPAETFFAAASVLWCLPQSRVDPECTAPGTVMRPATLAEFAREAGWSRVEALDIVHPFWRFYRLVR